MSLVVGAQESHLPLAVFLAQAPITVLLIYPASSLLYKEQRLRATVVRKFLLSDALRGSRVTPFHGIQDWQLSEPTWVHVAPQGQAASVNLPWTGPVAPISLSLNEYECQKSVTTGRPKDCRATECWMVDVKRDTQMFRVLMSLLAGHKAVRGGPFLNHEDAGN